MAAVTRNKYVRAGDWRTVETCYNTQFGCLFRAPQGAKIKLRTGIGWLGSDSQKQTLDGAVDKSINAKNIYARVQIKVPQDVNVSYVYVPTGP